MLFKRSVRVTAGRAPSLVSIWLCGLGSHSRAGVLSSPGFLARLWRTLWMECSLDFFQFLFFISLCLRHPTMEWVCASHILILFQPILPPSSPFFHLLFPLPVCKRSLSVSPVVDRLFCSLFILWASQVRETALLTLMCLTYFRVFFLSIGTLVKCPEQVLLSKPKWESTELEGSYKLLFCKQDTSSRGGWYESVNNPRLERWGSR